MNRSAILKACGWGQGEGSRKRALFTALCHHAGPKWWLYRVARRSGVSKQGLRAWVREWRPGSVCRGCGLDVPMGEVAIWHGYWTATWFPCHAACRDAGMKEEAFECQVIDADCNDCAHFQRGVERGPDAKRGDVLFPPLDGARGHCWKRGLMVTAHPKRASNNPCFEHRRNPKENACAPVEDALEVRA